MQMLKISLQNLKNNPKSYKIKITKVKRKIDISILYIQGKIDKIPKNIPNIERNKKILLVKLKKKKKRSVKNKK